MTIEHSPALGPTYNGFSGPAPRVSRGPSREQMRKILIGGVAAAVGLGVAMGLWARPQYRPGAKEPIAVSTPAPLAAGQVQIVLDPVHGAPAPASGVRMARLDVRPQGAAAPASSAAPAAVPAPRADLGGLQPVAAPPEAEDRSVPISEAAADPEALGLDEDASAYADEPPVDEEF